MQIFFSKQQNKNGHEQEFCQTCSFFARRVSQQFIHGLYSASLKLRNISKPDPTSTTKEEQIFFTPAHKALLLDTPHPACWLKIKTQFSGNDPESGEKMRLAQLKMDHSRPTGYYQERQSLSTTVALSAARPLDVHARHAGRKILPKILNSVFVRPRISFIFLMFL